MRAQQKDHFRGWSAVSAAVLISGMLLWVLPAYAAVLTHGPVFGGVKKIKAKVFVRTDTSATVAIQYGEDPALAVKQVTPAVLTSSGSDFTAVLPITRLRPNRAIYVNVLVDGVPQLRAPFPSFRTFSNTARDFKVVILTDFERPQNIAADEENSPVFLNAALEHDPPVAFAFIGGDFDHRNPRTIAAKRTMLKQLYDPEAAGMRDFVDLILRRMPIAHQWDDHDAGQDNVDKNYPYWSASYRAFSEYVPSYDFPGRPPAIYQYFTHAQVDFFVLDNRSQRDSALDPDDPDKSMLAGNSSASPNQLTWLKWKLLHSEARWKIIFSSVITNPTAKLVDGWAAYQTEWSDLRSFIEENEIAGVVFISGDLHMGGIDDGRAAGFPEMVVPRVTGGPDPGKNCSTGRPGEWSEGVFNNIGGPCAGYGVLTVLTDPDRLILEVKDEYGDVQVAHSIY